MLGLLTILVVFVTVGLAGAAIKPQNALVIPNNHPLIHYHGRWDSSPGTWWCVRDVSVSMDYSVLTLLSIGRAQDSSFKSLSLMLGEHTTSPLVSIGVSVDYQEFVTVNVTAGHNNIPVSSFLNDKGMDTNVIRINAEGWQNNRVNLESIILNAVRMFYFVYYESCC